MKIVSDIKFYYNSKVTAEKIAHLLEIDNNSASRTFNLKTFAKGKTVNTVLQHEKLSTSLSSIDDILFTERLITDILPLLKR
jgi:hypothetical protein|tara:strand:- start:251 stop:496 length:246 start_codon:yes stop_codon:yes gene_type:complete